MKTVEHKHRLFTTCASAFKEIRDHKLLALRAIVCGWTVLSLYILLFGPLLDVLARLASWSSWWRYGNIPILAMTCVSIIFCMASGWLVGRLHHAYKTAMVLIYAVSVGGVIFTLFFLGVSRMLQRGFPPPHFLLSLIGNLADVLGILVGGGVFLGSNESHN
jgi:hypothetical protein